MALFSLNSHRLTWPLEIIGQNVKRAPSASHPKLCWWSVRRSGTESVDASPENTATLAFSSVCHAKNVRWVRECSRRARKELIQSANHALRCVKRGWSSSLGVYTSVVIFNVDIFVFSHTSVVTFSVILILVCCHCTASQSPCTQRANTKC